jgi:hypothetical protein
MSLTARVKNRVFVRDQLDRAALPVSNNLAEILERGTTNELRAFV